ncbi:hypothetical protein F5X68DRAFT_124368, partial [Plectosphaerella plurivora]
SSPKLTIAFFGATGNLLGNVLAPSLEAGHHCIALVRSADKLRKVLTTLNVSQQALTNLTIVEASARSPTAIRQVLSHDVDLILSGLTSGPIYHFNPFRPVTMTDPTLIGDAAELLLTTLRELQAEGAVSKKPLYAQISSIGLAKRRDMPLLLVPLYHWLLPQPQADTAVMEELVVRAAKEDNAPIRGYVMMRPPLLTDGEPRGPKSLRVGWVRHDNDPKSSADETPGPIIGYTVARRDLAAWIFDQVVQGGDKWANLCVNVAY